MSVVETKDAATPASGASTPRPARNGWGAQFFFKQIGLSVPNAGAIAVAALGLAALYYANLYSFLLFHVLVEIFSVIVAFAIFMFAWNTRANLHNNSLILLGAAFLTIGAVDLLHTLSYKGMGIFTRFGADSATQLWIAARFIQGISLAAAPLFVNVKLPMARTVCVYVGILMLVIAAVFVWPIFPTCYVDGVGLTPFKKIGEYIISAILVFGLVILSHQRKYYDEVVFRQLAISILLTIVSELMFTFYISVYGISNLVGHLFKLGAFWLIYKAIIETGLQKPYALLFRELAQSGQRYRDLVYTLPTGICEITPDQRVTYINPAGLRIFGFTTEDVRQGLSLNLLLEISDQERARRRMDKLLQGQPVGGAEYSVRRKDGSKADVIVYSFPIFEEGRLKIIQTSITDVTEFKRLQGRLQEAQKMETVAGLAGGMAHEINNKLMGIVGRVEVLKLNMRKKPVSDADLADILNSCDRIAALIKYLLAYARGGRYRSERIDLTQFLHKIMPEMKPQIHPRVLIACDLPAGLPQTWADPVQLRMVVEEIVRNSAEAIEGDGRIDLRLQSETIDAAQAQQYVDLEPGRYLCLEVEDTGRGIDEQMLPRIFEPFYTDKFMGRGLGLAAVHGIVKNHGGWIGIDSKPGRGTRVRILLPAAPQGDGA
ncbi:MAG: PAS domain S-box protein [Desulfobacterales bacterium]|nr:PAS domain S-box protein [Desulfobacterales bacterium]